MVARGDVGQVRGLPALERRDRAAYARLAHEGDLPSLAKKKVSFRDMSGMIKNAFDALWDEREKKMGIEKLLNAVYDNADPHAAAPVAAVPGHGVLPRSKAAARQCFEVLAC